MNQIHEKFCPKVDEFIGFQITDFREEDRSVVGRLVVSDHNTQPFGLLHGGVSCLVAESIASMAANFSVAEDQAAVGQSLTANHIRSARAGDEITVTARNVHSGNRSQVWNVDLTRGDDLISQVILTISIISKK
ncbi:PaaI family thioesterase [Pseudobacteriovorax antillogorgiicola]|nr:PaaI family thioesterase [Pseudobacteriovorax antillogorgiicola]